MLRTLGDNLHREYKNQQVAVIGAVEKPGAMSPPAANLLQIILAGGFTETAGNELILREGLTARLRPSHRPQSLCQQ
jgi:protein involved in polysaccharide export with SLBB domain